MTEEAMLDSVSRKLFKTFRDAYQDKGWTQKYVAELLDINPQQFNRAIRGLDNTPKAKLIREKARDLLGIK
ncbi:transcriptional regulator [Lactiplantibacillus sp. WILCCON 0030]|uniref:Transcriptional regulator n=1 Tax=Lactiplantibacillus brownii TaxID=3069269 RepID=A0ABU1A8U6_9LACO|nr:transcriptional regulator [Lactiplantibacillus brownii]MDQ7937065.1 transcriptional regulator [Lactiplantibacillus brownii]